MTVVRAAAVLAVAGAALVACGKRPAGQARGQRADGDAAAAGAAADPWAKAPASDRSCERLPFIPEIPLAEASGAAWLRTAGGDVVVVTGDSGNRGVYVELDAGSGKVLRRGTLPLGEGSNDDVEALASDGRWLWGLTSSGWLRAWARDGDGFRLVLGPYPIEDDSPCAGTSVNCGHDYEGLCLRPVGARDAAIAPGEPACAGYVASRSEGTLYCLVREATPGGGTRLVMSPRVHDEEPHQLRTVTARRALADCAIDGAGAVWTADNAFGGSLVRRLGEPAWQASLGDGFPEAMALGPDGVIYRFSDTSSAPSLASRHRCQAAAAGPAGGAIASE